MTDSTPVRLLTIQQVCELTSLAEATIYRDMKAGTFPEARYVGRSARWRADDVQRWIDNLPHEAACQEERNESKRRFDQLETWQKASVWGIGLIALVSIGTFGVAAAAVIGVAMLAYAGN